MPETNFFWDPLSDNILQERDESGVVTADYTTEPGLYGNVINQNRSGLESQFHFDALGSSLAVTDDGENVTDARAYTAFGETAERTGGTEFPFQYVGQRGYHQHRIDLDTLVVRRRIYRASSSRWCSTDPIRELYYFKTTLLLGGSLTREAFVGPYVYCHNAPTRFSDPSGLDCKCVKTSDTPGKASIEALGGLHPEPDLNLNPSPFSPTPASTLFCGGSVPITVTFKCRETGKVCEPNTAFTDTKTVYEIIRGDIPYPATIMIVSASISITGPGKLADALLRFFSFKYYYAFDTSTPTARDDKDRADAACVGAYNASKLKVIGIVSALGGGAKEVASIPTNGDRFDCQDKKVQWPA